MSRTSKILATLGVFTAIMLTPVGQIFLAIHVFIEHFVTWYVWGPNAPILWFLVFPIVQFLLLVFIGYVAALWLTRKAYFPQV